MRIYIPEDTRPQRQWKKMGNIVEDLPYCSPSGMTIDNGSVHLRLV